VAAYEQRGELHSTSSQVNVSKSHAPVLFVGNL